MAKSNKEETRENNVDYVIEMTNDEYREKIISIFIINMERTDKLRFWYRYISAIEKGEV